MSTDTNDTDNDNGSNSTNTERAPQNFLQAALEQLTGDSPRVQSYVDVHGRYWLEDRANPDEAYVWSRHTVDVEAVR